MLDLRLGLEPSPQGRSLLDPSGAFCAHCRRRGRKRDAALTHSLETLGRAESIGMRDPMSSNVCRP